jgi:hypothetical protein
MFGQNNNERPKAEPIPAWKKWKREMRSGKNAGPINTPDGREYLLSEEEKFVLDPKEPEGEKMPEAFIEINGNRIPFEDWAKDKKQRYQ